MQTVFVTLNWNTTDLLFAMFDSVENTVDGDHRWVIVDNGSSKEEYNDLSYGLAQRCNGVAVFHVGDKQWETIAKAPKVCLIRSAKNLGCVLGHNLAFDFIEISARREPFEIVMLDTDVEIFQKGWLTEVKEWCWGKPVGIVGMEHAEGECCAGAVFLDPSGNWYIHQGQTLQPVPIRSESVGLGFALILGRVTAAGLRFDTGFEMYYKQDDDLCFQVRADLGLEVWAYPVAGVHWGSGGLKINEYDVGKYHGWDPFDQMKQRNQKYFSKKWEWALRDRRGDISGEQSHLEVMAREMAKRGD